MEPISLKDKPANVYTSPTGKDVEIIHVEQTSLYEVIFAKGGAKPKEFEGMFTSPGKAKIAIEQYFNRVQREHFDSQVQAVAQVEQDKIAERKVEREELKLKASK